MADKKEYKYLFFSKKRSLLNKGKKFTSGFERIAATPTCLGRLETGEVVIMTEQTSKKESFFDDSVFLGMGSYLSIDTAKMREDYKDEIINLPA